MNLRHGGEVEPEARIGRDHHVDLAAELTRQHGALDVAAGKLPDGRIWRAGLDLIARDPALGLLAKFSMLQPPAAGGERRTIEIAERQIVGHAHARDAGVLERLLREAGELVAAHLRARGVVTLAGDADFAAARLALPGQDLDQLALAVAGDPRDPDDLARPDGQGDIVQRRLAGIVERAQAIDVKPRCAELADA